MKQRDLAKGSKMERLNLACRALVKDVEALTRQCKRSDNALAVVRREVNVSWAGTDGRGFSKWYSFLSNGRHLCTDHLGHMAFQAIIAFQGPGAEKRHEDLVASIEKELEDRVNQWPVRVWVGYSMINGQVYVRVKADTQQNIFCAMYHALERAISASRTSWGTAIAAGADFFHLLPHLREACEARSMLQEAYTSYLASCTDCESTLEAMRCVLGLLKCNQADEHNHRDAVGQHPSESMYDIKQFVEAEECRVLDSVPNGQAYDYIHSALDLRRLAQEAATVRLGVAVDKKVAKEVEGHLAVLQHRKQAKRELDNLQRDAAQQRFTLEYSLLKKERSGLEPNEVGDGMSDISSEAETPVASLYEDPPSPQRERYSPFYSSSPSRKRGRSPSPEGYYSKRRSSDLECQARDDARANAHRTSLLDERASELDARARLLDLREQSLALRLLTVREEERVLVTRARP